MYQGHSLNDKYERLSKGDYLKQAGSLFNSDFFIYWELLLKERSCSLREQLLSFKSSLPPLPLREQYLSRVGKSLPADQVISFEYGHFLLFTYMYNVDSLTSRHTQGSS